MHAAATYSRRTDQGGGSAQHAPLCLSKENKWARWEGLAEKVARTGDDDEDTGWRGSAFPQQIFPIWVGGNLAKEVVWISRPNRLGTGLRNRWRSFFFSQNEFRVLILGPLEMLQE